MIPQNTCAPVFFYGYCPLDAGFQVDPMDGGFHITLYADARLVFEAVDLQGNVREQRIYDLAPSMVEEYHAFLETNNNAISSLPIRQGVEENRMPRFRSSIGLQGFPFITCDDAAHLCHMPFSSVEGRNGRRLCVLLEDLAEVFTRFGVHFDLCSFEVDDSVVQPINQTPEMDTVWMTGSAS